MVVDTRAKEGKDESVVRMIFSLLELEKREVEQRAKLLVDLGQRYLLLALAREEGRDLSAGETVDILLDERLVRVLTCQLVCQLDALAVRWYQYAIACFSSAIQQTAVASYVAVLTRAAALARLGSYPEAMADLHQAASLADTPRKLAEVFYRRGGVLVEQHLIEGALLEFSQAHQLCPDVQKFAKTEHQAFV